MSTILVFLCLFFVQFSLIDCRAYGQRVEYRYEYDPKRDSHPRVHVKFDDVTDETELMRIFNHRKPMEVRKAPSRYEYTQPAYIEENAYMIPYSEMDRGNQDNGWRNVALAETQQWHHAFQNLPIEKFFETDSREDITEQMASFLRQQSESILSHHFDNVPRSRFSDPPHFKFLKPTTSTYIPKFAF